MYTDFDTKSKILSRSLSATSLNYFIAHVLFKTSGWQTFTAYHDLKPSGFCKVYVSLSRSEEIRSSCPIFLKPTLHEILLIEQLSKMMNMMQKSRQASKASMISSVPEEAASTNDRVLLYPKGFITISLDIPRSKCMFVIVKVRCGECGKQKIARCNCLIVSILIAKSVYFFTLTADKHLPKTKVLDDIVELGRTDSHETLGDEIVTFDKVIEITYFSGE